MTALPRVRCLLLLQQGSQMTLNQLKQIHAQVIVSGSTCRRSASAVANLIESYCDAVSTPEGIDHARLVFRHFEEPNLIIWNTMIRCMLPLDAIALFADGVSRSDLVFDNLTYTFVLGSCARSSAFSEGKQIHGRVIKLGFESNVFVQTTGIHFYARCSDIGSARKLFDKMPVRTSATWNAMIAGYCSQGRRVGDHACDSFALFRDMLIESLVKPSETTVVCVLSACSHMGILEKGTCIHGYIQKTIYAQEDDVFIGTGLVDMYSKCGCVSSALCVFKRMKVKNEVTWTAMVAGLAVHGLEKEALELLDAMKADNVRPNSVTFTSLLCACCHAGLIEEGLCLFNSMSSEFHVTPQIQHYGCIVDLLGRAGSLQEAYEFIVRIPIKPDVILWRSLLNACNVHGDVEMGGKVGKILLQLHAEQKLMDSMSTCEDYVALSNVYASAQRWDNVEMVREMMKTRGVQTKPGCSYVSIN